jgi:hypothetical protein
MSNENNQLSVETIKQLSEKIDKLQKVIMALFLDTELSNIQSIMSQLKGEQTAPETIKAPAEAKSDVSHSQALDNLAQIATTKNDTLGKRLFLLYRPTEDHEYAKYIHEGSYDPETETEWTAAVMTSEKERQGKNPVVACWIPEAFVKNIPNPHINTGTWGDLGKNPFAAQYKVVVKPGKYDLYQELKS